MRELTASPSPIEWWSETTSGVRLVTLQSVVFRSVRGGTGDAVVIAADRNRSGGGRELLYLEVGPEGVREVLVEEVTAATPALCAGPDGAPWMRMSLLEDGSDQEPDTVLPLRGRSGWEQPPRTSPFAGDFVGWIGNRAFWHLDDVFDTRRPARIQAADLSSGTKGPRLRFRCPVRLPLPQSRDAVVCTGGTHLAVLALDDEPMGAGPEMAGPETAGPTSLAMLRVLAPDTLAVVRELPVVRDPDEAFLLLAEAAPDGAALLYSVADDGRVTAVRLDRNGVRSATPAGALPAAPFSVWQVRGPGHHALRFTTEHSSGLLVLDGATLVARWVGGPHRYVDTVQGREVPLGADWADPVLSGVATTGQGHALVLTREDNPPQLALLFV
ncbi:beta-propeller fold lactonase family protein [Streptacidiphilus sp. PAMC 29251]